MPTEIQNIIRELRTARSITQEDLAARIGVTRQTIIAIERGNYIPSLLLAFKLARVFKKEIESIFNMKNV